MQRIVFQGLNMEVQGEEARHPMSPESVSVLLCCWTKHDKASIAVTPPPPFPWKPGVDAAVTVLASSAPSLDLCI